MNSRKPSENYSHFPQHPVTYPAIPGAARYGSGISTPTKTQRSSARPGLQEPMLEHQQTPALYSPRIKSIMGWDLFFSVVTAMAYVPLSVFLLVVIPVGIWTLLLLYWTVKAYLGYQAEGSKYSKVLEEYQNERQRIHTSLKIVAGSVFICGILLGVAYFSSITNTFNTKERATYYGILSVVVTIPFAHIIYISCTKEAMKNEGQYGLHPSNVFIRGY